MIEMIAQTWVRGGWVMLPLAVVSLMMFTVGLRLILQMRRWPDRWGTEADWQKWVGDPGSASQEARGLLVVAGVEEDREGEVHRRCLAATDLYTAGADRQLALLSTLVAAGPLVGLLGTVTGMLATFRALALGGGGQITEAMAAGISQALFPPEVGLCMALPGMMMVHWARRRRHEWEAFAARLESLLIQRVRLRKQRSAPVESVALVEA